MGLSGTILLHFWVFERGLVGLGRHKRSVDIVIIVKYMIMPV